MCIRVKSVSKFKIKKTINVINSILVFSPSSDCTFLSKPLAKNVRMSSGANPQEIRRSLNDVKSLVVVKSATNLLHPPNIIAAFEQKINIKNVKQMISPKYVV